ncbi:hypothetical protein PVNG_02353 [Plasmodium vivax North Korean]|uniref:DHHA1 domain-containing protein n=1 Tax=Plasmodium vivax North Korean TaxID=1035514 RepID=A0A0J9TKG3_PLAVI|nr:hypothetical protein PVNG_02353 [Plasmodium vivax North Korean]
MTSKSNIPLKKGSPRSTISIIEEEGSLIVGLKLFYRSSDEQRVSEIIERAKQFEPSPKVSVFLYPGLINIEIQSNLRDKFSFVEFLANFLGVPFSNILTFGDNHNDIPMMKGGISTIGYIEDSVMWMMFTEASPSEIRVNLRSIGLLNVCKLAEEFGGGGHFNAAGTTLTSVEQVKVMVQRARELVSEFLSSNNYLSNDEEIENHRQRVMDKISPPYKVELGPREYASLSESRDTIGEIRREIKSAEEIKVIDEEIKKERDLEEILGDLSSSSEVFDDIEGLGKHTKIDDFKKPHFDPKELENVIKKIEEGKPAPGTIRPERIVDDEKCSIWCKIVKFFKDLFKKLFGSSR